MEKMKMLYSICLDNRNIQGLLKIIRNDIKLSQRSLPKCTKMIEDIMKENISKLSRPPRNKDELKEIVRFLNKLCVNTIIEIIAKKYPDLQILRKKQISKEKMRRELEIWRDRKNHIQDRHHINTRRQYDDDETFYSMRPNDIGVAGSNESSNYASAFSNHSITGIPVGEKQIFNNPHSQKNASEIEKRYEQMMAERNYDGVQRGKPETPDFTLDGSGEKVKREKMLRKMQETGLANMGNLNLSNLNNFPGGMDNMSGTGITGMSMDDPYATLLGAGAPMQGQNMFPCAMGAGNPLIPISSTNMMASQMGFNSMQGFGMENQSVKAMQLQNDYEKKLAERRMIDIETNQPQATTQNYNNQITLSPLLMFPNQILNNT